MSPLTLRRNKSQDTTEPGLQDLPDIPDERPFPGYVRVNLLPKSFLDRQKLRTIKRWLAAALVLDILLLAGMWYMAQRDIAAAQAELQVAQMQQAQLQAQKAQYSEVPRVFAQAALGQQALEDAMSREVRWAFLLNQLSFATPAGVTLNTVAGAIGEEGPVATSPGEVLPPVESVGTMTFAGTGDSFSQVAAWLDSLQGLQDYTYPFLTNSTKTEATTPGAGTIDWESTANLSANALSGRYGTPPPATAPSSSSSGGAAPAPAPDGASQ